MSGFRPEKRYFVSESSVYRILSAEDLITAPAHVVIKAADEFRDRTTRPNELWQTDFTYLKVIGWGWFYLSTILDDYSRYIIAWKLCTTMKATDGTDTLELALEASGCSDATVVQKPRLLSDNGSSYVAADLAGYLEGKGMDHVRGAPNHPPTQGKIERWHQTMKNRVLLHDYFLPGDEERQIGAFVDHYNNHRHHESLAKALTFFARSASMMVPSSMGALSFSLRNDTASLAHRDAVSGKRHPCRLWPQQDFSNEDIPVDRKVEETDAPEAWCWRGLSGMFFQELPAIRP